MIVASCLSASPVSQNLLDRLVEEPIRYFIVLPHAAESIAHRGLSLDLVQEVLAAPEQRIELRTGRVVLQARRQMEGSSKMYLIRVIVDTDRRPAVVVTAYRTSRIAKYWRLGS